LNIPFPPFEIDLLLSASKPYRFFKSIEDEPLFPAENRRQAELGWMTSFPSVALQHKITYHSTLAWRRESMMLTEKNLNGIDFKK